MLIRFTGRAEVIPDNGAVEVPRSTIRELDGAESEEVCSNYLDRALAELGLTGGTVKLTHDAGVGQFLVVTEYLSPVKLDTARLRQLTLETVGQWSDGIGEGCFDDLAERLGVAINLSPLGQEQDLLIEQIDDGREVAAPRTALAKAAREGDMASLRKHLDAEESLEARVQGYTPLHLAIIYGHAEAALELIARGADITARELTGEDPLMLAAESNRITDEDAARVAEVLLERGAPVHGPRGVVADPTQGEYTPLFMAENRRKTKLAAVLRAFGAVK